MYYTVFLVLRVKLSLFFMFIFHLVYRPLFYEVSHLLILLQIGLYNMEMKR